LEFVKILIFITVDIFKHTAQKNKKIKRADQILPEVYGTTLKQLNKNIQSYNINMGYSLLTVSDVWHLQIKICHDL